jgi:hypothetical protein
MHVANAPKLTANASRRPATSGCDECDVALAASRVRSLHANAQRDRVGYNDISIPSDFDIASKSAFDKVYMGALFEAGYNAALQSEPRQHQPPGL